MMRRWLTTSTRKCSHENPLGLPRAPSSSPSNIPSISDRLANLIRERDSKSSPPSPSVVARTQRGLPPKRRLRNVSHTIAVSSAKGGVGKSTLSVNLALALSRHGSRVGVLDADIFGPSIPTLLGLSEAREPGLTAGNELIPLTSFGVRSMSMGYLLPSEQAPVAWRGLMVMKALQQLLHEVSWAPGLDVLVIDMPPGTGDVQLTIGQQVEMDGAVVVSTPQDVALKDAVKGVEMFKTMKIPVLGMVQNMSVFVCPKCGEETKIFAHDKRGGRGGVDYRAKELGVDVLGNVPLHESICYDADRGMPTIVAEEASGQKINTPYYERIAEKVAKKIGLNWT